MLKTSKVPCLIENACDFNWQTVDAGTNVFNKLSAIRIKKNTRFLVVLGFYKSL